MMLIYLNIIVNEIEILFSLLQDLRNNHIKIFELHLKIGIGYKLK